MKIEEKGKITKEFRSLVPGECFTINNKTYMKTETEIVDNGHIIFNCVCLTDNKIICLCGNTKVEPFKSATLYYDK